MKRPLQAILIAGEEGKDNVLNGVQRLTIREGDRDYQKGNVLIGCHILNWATMKNITSVRHTKLSWVKEEEYEADGYESKEEMLENLKKFYPNLTEESEVTVVRWE